MTLTNRQIEDLAIAFVLKREHVAGRRAEDVRAAAGLADIEGDRLIEVKACGGSARGTDLWLETRQVEAALVEPERFHLVIVDNVRQGDPDRFGIVDLSGDDLIHLLARKRERRYFEVPFPVALYDRLRARDS